MSTNPSNTQRNSDLSNKSTPVKGKSTLLDTHIKKRCKYLAQISNIQYLM